MNNQSITSNNNNILHWIHISDIHLNKVGIQAEIMKENLPIYIQEISNNTKIDYVFFTGDIRFAPKKTFPTDKAIGFFEEICSYAKIDKEKLFIVIGNHDLDRENQTRLAAIKKIESQYFESDGVINQKQIQELKSGRDDYLNTIKQILTPEHYKFHSDVSKLHFVIESDKMNIVHVDSLLTYRKTKENGFIIGTYDLKKTLEQCNKEKPTVILSHYSLDSLEPVEQKTVLLLLKKYNVQLWFAGHKHTDIIYKDRDYFYVVHSGNQTFDSLTNPSFVEGFLNLDSGEGQFIVHRWNENADWAVYQTLIDRTDLRSEKSSDRTKYPFVLDCWLNSIGKVAQSHTDATELLKNYLRNYKGKSFLISHLEQELGLNKKILLEVLDLLKSEKIVRPVNYEKSQWEILQKF